MKNKIFKLLSVVMALAMVFTMFACVVHAEETPQDVIVDGVITPALASGTVNGAPKTLDTCVGEHAIRLYTVNTYKVAEIDKVIVGEGCRAFVQLWKEDGSYHSGKGWLATGTHKIESDAMYLKITFDSADGSTIPPADGLKLTVKEALPEDVIVDGVISPSLASGTVNGAPKTLETCVGEHAIRLYTVTTYKASEINEVIVGEGCRAFVQFWKEDGSYNEGSGWLFAGTHKVEKMKGFEGATFFKITFDSEDGSTTPPTEGLKLTVKEAAPQGDDVIVDGVISPFLASGTVNGAPKTLDTCVGEHAIRLYTVNTYKVAEVDEVIVGEGCKAFVQFWKEDGSYNGGSGWIVGPVTKKVAEMGGVGGATFLKITFDSEDGTTTPPASGLKLTAKEAAPEGSDTVVDGVISPLLASGTVNGAPKTLETCVGEHAIRLYTVTTYKVSEINEVIVGEGCKAFVQFWKEDGSYNGGSGWIVGPVTKKVAEMGGVGGATFLKITFDSEDGTTTPPADGLKLTAKEAAPEGNDTVVDGVISPLLASGTVNGAPKTLDTCVGEHAIRLYTVNTYKVAEIDEVIVAEGCRAFVQLWNEDGSYHSGKGWLLAGTHKIESDAAFLKITFDSEDGTTTPPADGLKLTVKPVSEEPETHEHSYAKDGFCTGCGIYKVLEPTLVKVDGVWTYYVDGVKSDDTTLVKYNGEWYHVKNGLKTTSTTLVKYNGKWYYVEKGVKSTKTTLVKYNGVWYYVKDGKKNTSTTLVKYNGVWYYVKSGKKSTATTLVKYNGVWYYVKSGKKNTSTTLVKYNGTWYYVKSGKKNTSTAIVKYNGKKYYVKKGIAQLKFSGKVKISGKTYTVKKGVVK